MDSVLTFELEADELEVFREDVAELLQAMETGILSLERSSDAETVNSVFRAAHTLKAMAGAVGHKPMADVTHTMEFLFDAMREKRLSATQSVIDELLGTLDVIKALRDEVVNNKPSGVDCTGVLERLTAIKDDCEGRRASQAQSAPMRLLLSAERADQANGLREEGHAVLEVHVCTIPGAVAPAARLLQAAMALMEMGQVIVQRPTQSELASNKHDGYLTAVIAVQSDIEAVEDCLEDIHDLTVVRIQEYPLEVPTAAKASASNSPGATSSSTSRADSAGFEADATVRIHVDRLDVLMNLVGELVTDRNRLAQVASGAREQFGREGVAAQLGQMSAHFDRVVDQLQGEVMRFRMLPISHLFERFPRLVRDLSRSQGKKVRLAIEGEGTELDRSLIEGVSDPLIHLLRNAVDHGVEMPDERVAAGKPATATIKLTASHMEGHIVIGVEDDGKGIDPDRVKAAAVRRGLLSRDQAAQLSPREAVNLIFRPNLSTAEKITEVSGRGVGMDVVRSKVERLSGNVEVDSEVGKGTSIRLSLPLTLAIVQTLLVDVDGAVYAIPLASIIDSLYLSEVTINSMKGRPIISWRDTALPLLDLRGFFDGGSAAPTSRNGGKPAIVTVAWGTIQTGLVVSEIIGKQEIVVKSLSPVVGEVAGLSGCAILGDGRIALIVDIPDLINAAMGDCR